MTTKLEGGGGHSGRTPKLTFFAASLMKTIFNNVCFPHYVVDYAPYPQSGLIGVTCRLQRKEKKINIFV